MNVTETSFDGLNVFHLIANTAKRRWNSNDVVIPSLSYLNSIDSNLKYQTNINGNNVLFSALNSSLLHHRRTISDKLQGNTFSYSFIEAPHMLKYLIENLKLDPNSTNTN